MGFLIFLLVGAVIWLLWTIHQDLLEANQRQRNTRMELVRLGERLDQLLADRAPAPQPPALAAPVAEPAAPAQPEERVNLNVASKAALRTLPQVGAATAERIIAARPYQSVDELRNVSGISSGQFEALKDRVSAD